MLQREEDTVACKHVVQSYIHQQPIDGTSEPSLKDVLQQWTSFPKPSHSSLSSSVSSQSLSLTEFPLNNDTSVSSTTREEIDMDEPSKVTIQDFQLIKVLGKGYMGKVFLVRTNSFPQLYALKAVSKSLLITPRDIEQAKMERDILSSLAKIRHPFLVRLHHSFQDANQLFLLLDYHAGGDLATQLALFVRFTPQRCKLYTAEILLGLQELHRLGILYRDLKPENILLSSDGHLVLTDFGLSKQFEPGLSMDNQRTRTFCGTPEYIAPEILQSREYSYEVDYWSLGTILYEMLVGETPFWANSPTEMYRRVVEDELEFPEDIDLVTADFIASLLEREPSRRLGTPNGGGPHSVRCHPYFDRLDWSAVYDKRTMPPYIPQLQSETDFSHVHPEFLRMAPKLSSTISNAFSESLQSAFHGYSFNEGSMAHSLRSSFRSMIQMEQYSLQSNLYDLDALRMDVSDYSESFSFDNYPQSVHTLSSYNIIPTRETETSNLTLSLDSIRHVDEISWS
ncbi:hypothetical protein EC973_004990 [Apophysomyces ossiformis]|uniref:Uncharacterized protein n=1 Tax=Apophysomyces ossiformis TaxID=679940 RepID=A0A8H7EKA0_9FUNG|nr:hypothetical protein EC973_004990 [Apophysomyces ossiformis]